MTTASVNLRDAVEREIVAEAGLSVMEIVRDDADADAVRPARDHRILRLILPLSPAVPARPRRAT